MIGARENKQFWIALGVSALVHLALVLWIAMPSVQVPQIAGGGAAFGLDGTIGEGDSTEITPIDVQEESIDEAVQEEELEPLDLAEPLTPPPLQQTAPLPQTISQPIAASPRAPAAAKPAPQRRAPAARPTPAAKPAAKPKPKAPSAAASANTSSKADPSAKAGNDTGTGSAKSGAGDAAKTNYAGRVFQHLERKRRSNTTGAGSANIALTIGLNGKLESSSISRSSGSSKFDREALRRVKRASPYPKPPPGINRRLIIEIKGS